MNPESASDRLTLLRDFAESCTVTPIGGGPSWPLLGIPNRPSRRPGELALSDGLAPVEVTGSAPSLLIRREDAERLAQGDEVDVPKWAPMRFSVHTIEPDEETDDFRVAELLELEA